ncbi:MAG: STAS domain-containing protein [Clostridiales Family XIII bacterium]|jgi:anti-sigma B factor antagonist|nr:STAS domain-containing protein [Clostridiales Family XIII bacterium]
MSLIINGNFDEAESRWNFRLAGEIDISNALQLKKQLETAYAARAADIYINVGDLSYIDSTGLGIIIGIYGTIHKSGYRIVLLEPKENVKKLLKITNLDKVLS